MEIPKPEKYLKLREERENKPGGLLSISDRKMFNEAREHIISNMTAGKKSVFFKTNDNEKVEKELFRVFAEQGYHLSFYSLTIHWIPVSELFPKWLSKAYWIHRKYKKENKC